MTLLRLILVLVFLGPQVSAQEKVVSGLSKDNISLNARFDGSELFVFGAVRRDAPPPEETPLDVIITIKGPKKNIMVRKKSWWYGIWVNRDSVKVENAPSYYAIASTGRMTDLISEQERARYQIGMDHAVAISLSENDTSDFSSAVVRLRLENGLYDEANRSVNLDEETLFQTNFSMPSNIIEGNYVAEFFLVRNHRIIAASAEKIEVRKTGIERWLYNLAQQQPLIYGAFSVLLALAAGWLAATAFRLSKR